jgi:hypothetical protein
VHVEIERAAEALDQRHGPGDGSGRGAPRYRNPLLPPAELARIPWSYPKRRHSDGNPQGPDAFASSDPGLCLVLPNRGEDRMQISLTRLAFAATSSLMACPVLGHHSMAVYDQATEIRLQGVVTDVDWVNPHVYISVETDEGVVWKIEGGATPVMRKSGWAPDSVLAGDSVIVTAHPHRDAERRLALGRKVERADGSQLVFRPGNPGSAVSQTQPAIAAQGLSGQWLPRTNLPLYSQLASESRPTTGLTSKGLAALQSFDLSTSLECANELPAPYAALLPLLMNIEIGEDETLIRIEPQTTTRTVHMNVFSHEDAAYSVQGHSIGWWDDDVLVIDTTHFANSDLGHGRGLPSGPLKHLVERFELNTEKTGLTYTFWVADPEYRSEPVTATLQLSYRPDLIWSNEPCDPEIARLPL